MRKNPARVAWAVLLVSFITFCLLVVSIPLAVRWFVLHGQVQESALLRVTSGTVLLLPDADGEPVAVVDSRAVEAGTLIRTDQRSQGTLIFHAAAGNGAGDGPEIATVQIYPSAQVLLANTSRPRFAASSDPARVAVEVSGGRARIYTADATGATPNGQEFTVITPHATVNLSPGSYAVQVSADQTQIATRFGQATVEANGQQVVVPEGTSTSVLPGQAPGEPSFASENLIANGDFQQPLGPPHWLITKYPADDPTAGQVETTVVSGRTAARFSRVNQPPTHTEVGITQVLDRSVHDYESLNLQVDVLLRWQSLPGAGEQSSEFPLMLRLDYEDIYGNHQFWTHGFYYQDPPAQWVVTGGEKIPQNTWFPFESGNLFERLKLDGLPPPAKINYLKLYASGHNYDSLVSEVGLVAR